MSRARARDDHLSAVGQREHWRQIARGRGILGDVWEETATGRKEIVWRLQDGREVSAPVDGTQLRDGAVLALVKPKLAWRDVRWWRVFAALPVVADGRRRIAEWDRVGFVRLLQYQSGLRFDLEVWRRDDGRFSCLAPPWTKRFVWMGDGSVDCGTWALDLWREAFLRCRAAALAAGSSTEDAAAAMGFVSARCSPRWYHRARPRAPLLGPNGWGMEIDAVDRARRLVAYRAGLTGRETDDGRKGDG